LIYLGLVMQPDELQQGARHALGSFARTTMWRMRIVAAAAVVLGGFMLFDGLRALLLGDYLTPTSGPYAGQLGPWADVVSAIGVTPRGFPMKLAFTILGASWLVALIVFVRRSHTGRVPLLLLSVLTLWYLPVGTILSLVILAVLGPQWTRDRRAAARSV
jgi:hypothetical protein